MGCLILLVWEEAYANAIRAELRIHDETEKGDNETIKIGAQGPGAATGKCCGGER